MKIVALDIETLFEDCDDENCIENNRHYLKSLYDESDEVIFCRNLNLKNYSSEEKISNVVREQIKDADIVITNKVKLNKSNLNSNISLILVSATGTNNICHEDAENLGIRVQNCVAYGINSVVQHTLSLMLALTNKISKSDRDVRNGDWGRSSSFCLCNNFPTVELSSAAVGIIGYGAIGKKIAEVVKALGAKVLISERKGVDEIRTGRTSFEDVLSSSDIISIHCPLTSETNNLITSNELSKMKKSAYIVNVARGGVVNEKDLYNALCNNVIAGAATDVLTTEPPINNVLIDNKYPDNLIVTPHVAWGTLNARLEIIRQMSDHIKNFKTKN